MIVILTQEPHFDALFVHIPKMAMILMKQSENLTKSLIFTILKKKKRKKDSFTSRRESNQKLSIPRVLINKLPVKIARLVSSQLINLLGNVHYKQINGFEQLRFFLYSADWE